MKWRFAISALAVLFGGFALGNPSGVPKTLTLPYNLKVTPLAADTYVVTDLDFFDSNTLVVKVASGAVVVVSSPFEKLGTRSLMDWVEKTLAPTHTVAINPHFHLDGTGGNEVYKVRGVETWSSSLTGQLRLKANEGDRTKGAAFYKDLALRKRILDSHPIPAQNQFEHTEGKVFTFGAERVEVSFPGPAHSPDNVVVYFPSRKLLFGGCMIKPKELGNLSDANLKAWPSSARNLLRFDVSVVIPGHGPWGGRELIHQTIEVAERASATAIK